MKYLFHLFLILFIFPYNIHSMEKTDNSAQTRYVYIIVPGQGDFGGRKEDGKLPPTIPTHYKEIIRIKTPNNDKKTIFSNFSSGQDDFGQKNCQDLLHEQLDALFEELDIKFIFHAYSQGTASILNYINSLELTDKNQENKRTSKIEALILESVMISGFSAINTYTNNHLFDAQRIPYSDRIIPILAQKTTFPNFDINGMQTIDILENIPKTFPIIILHAPKDYILPYCGALAMYQMLQQQKNKVYFVPVDRNVHIDMMSQNIQHREDASHFIKIQNIAYEVTSAIIKILNKHGILNIKQEVNRENNPIFDKRYDIKHFTHVNNVRFLYKISHPIKTLPSFFSITVPLTMLCISMYIKQT